jgi:hypothetical protein
MVARHPAPPSGKSVTVGKRIDKWVYELFLTDLDADGFLAEDILDLYHGRGADRGQCSPMKMLKSIQIAGVPLPSVGKSCGKLPVNGCGTCASHLDKRCRKLSYARLSGHLPKNLPRCSSLSKTHLRSMDRGSGPQRSDEPLDASGQLPSPCKGTGRCAVQQGQPCG